MSTRHAISVNDDRGIYQIALGARRVTWETMKRTLEEDYALEDGVTFDAEPLLGWTPWQWAIHATNPNAIDDDLTVCFVTGDEEPELPYAR